MKINFDYIGILKAVMIRTMNIQTNLYAVRWSRDIFLHNIRKIKKLYLILVRKTCSDIFI